MSSILASVALVLANSALLVTAGRIIDSVQIEQDIFIILMGGVLLWIGDYLVKPIIRFISLPLVILTLGILRVAISFIVLAGIIYIAPGVEILDNVIQNIALLSLFISIGQTIANYIISFLEQSKK